MAVNKSFDINIMDFKALDNFTNYLDNMPLLIESALDEAMDEIASKVRLRMLSELAKYGLGGSSLASSIRIESYLGGLRVVVDSDHAIFVEFGTGIKAMSGKPHPNKSFFGRPFEYASGPQSSKGVWWYEIDLGYAKAHNIPVQKGADGNWYASTTGMKPRPFIYNSYQYARYIVTKTVNKHLKEVL